MLIQTGLNLKTYKSLQVAIDNLRFSAPIWDSGIVTKIRDNPGFTGWLAGLKIDWTGNRMSVNGIIKWWKLKLWIKLYPNQSIDLRQKEMKMTIVNILLPVIWLPVKRNALLKKHIGWEWKYVIINLLLWLNGHLC